MVTAEIANLGANLMAGVVSNTLVALLADREAEKTRLEAALRVQPEGKLGTLPDAAELSDVFAKRAARLTETLSDEAVRGEAAEILSRLIESVTIYPGEDGSAEAEVVAKIEDLVAFATNAESPPRGGERGCSMAVVAGTGFEPVTFRL